MSKFGMSKQKFINQWLRHFAKGASKDSLNELVNGKYIWHIFSYDLIDKNTYLVGDEARNAYDSADKQSCIFCDMFGTNGVTDKMLDEYASSESIDSHISELYVVSKDFSWTYIKTHENGLCGPYFLKNELY